MRVEHTHGLNKEKCQGGHYHYDITPEVIEYTGYFNLAECKIPFLKVIVIRGKCIMPCPFTGPKMFGAGQIFLWRTKNSFTY